MIGGDEDDDGDKKKSLRRAAMLMVVMVMLVKTRTPVLAQGPQQTKILNSAEGPPTGGETPHDDATARPPSDWHGAGVRLTSQLSLSERAHASQSKDPRLLATLPMNTPHFFPLPSPGHHHS